MIENVQLFDRLLVFIGVAVLVGFFYGPWQKLVVDVIRQQLFEIRDRVFDMAANGEFAFDSVQYNAFRDTINSMIRNAPTSTVWRHIAYALIIRGKGMEVTSTMINAITNGDPNHVLKKEFNRACAWITLMIWLRSPLLMVTTIALCVALPIAFLMAAVSVRVRHIPAIFSNAIRHQIQRDTALSMGHDSDDCALA